MRFTRRSGADDAVNDFCIVPAERGAGAVGRRGPRRAAAAVRWVRWADAETHARVHVGAASIPDGPKLHVQTHTDTRTHAHTDTHTHTHTRRARLPVRARPTARARAGNADDRPARLAPLAPVASASATHPRPFRRPSAGHPHAPVAASPRAARGAHSSTRRSAPQGLGARAPDDGARSRQPLHRTRAHLPAASCSEPHL